MKKPTNRLDLVEGFDWDKYNVAHIAKHKVEFAECEQVFFNQPIIIWQDLDHSKNETRFGVLGITNSSRKLALVFTVRKKLIRVLQARDQSKTERKLFDIEAKET